VRRREFLGLMGAVATAWPIAARAQQQTANVARIGYLGSGRAAAFASRVDALRGGLRDLGYVEGRNIIIEFRWAQRDDQLPELAADLVRMNVDVIFATSSTEVEPARQATKTIPIVFATHADPVGIGHVASLPRPGGNITGLTMLLTDLAGKELEILKETMPHVMRIGILWNPTTPSHPPALRAVKAAAERLSVQLVMLPVRTVEDFDGAFSMMARERVGGFLALGSPLFVIQRVPVTALALKHRLPSMFAQRDPVEAGGLLSYGADLDDLTRRAAAYIDKILKGAKPADLPVEQASKYQLVINLKTAKALGLSMPPALIARADEVIE
jgi:putative tryptophan/tyrosine transport system substrate-binding protein